MADEVEENKTKPAGKLSITGLKRALVPLTEDQINAGRGTKTQAVYGRGQMKGAGAGAAAAQLAPYVIEEIIKNAPPMEEAKTVEDLERGRIKPQVEKIMGPEASKKEVNMSRGQKDGPYPKDRTEYLDASYSDLPKDASAKLQMAGKGLKKGGRVASKPRGVGVALRGFGKAMKGGK